MAHIPVLLDEVIENLDIQKGEILLDGTLGNGGHGKIICGHLGKAGRYIGIDMDSDAIDTAKEALSKCNTEVILREDSFRNLDKVLLSLGIKKVNKILFDLGTRMDQIKVSDRGFTFRKDEPLLMTFKKKPGTSDVTAEVILNEWEQETIADIIYGYGEEKYSRKIAAAIVEKRKKHPLKTTMSLVSILDEVLPERYKRGKTHFATKTFQAIRMAVNDELESLKDGLRKGFDELDSGGRFAVISFHSLEDRVVKRFFRDRYTQGEALRITKKPITPTQDEISKNPASRSAKLRVIEKI